MLKHRIIPIVLIDGFSVFKTIKFGTRRNLGSPITVLQTYETRNVDELIMLDINASLDNRCFDRWLVEELSENCFMPLTIGGGIKSCLEIENLLKALQLSRFRSPCRNILSLYLFCMFFCMSFAPLNQLQISFLRIL